jgi:hypothetical protein
VEDELSAVESPLPRLADLSLRVLEDFADPFEGPADVWTLGMESPAAHFSQFAPELSEAHLDVAQPALDGSRPVAAAPALLGLAVRLICHDEFLLVAPRQPPSPGFSSSPKERLAVRLRSRFGSIPNRHEMSTIVRLTAGPSLIGEVERRIFAIGTIVRWQLRELPQPLKIQLAEGHSKLGRPPAGLH